MVQIRCLFFSAFFFNLVSCSSDSDPEPPPDSLSYPGLSVHGLGGEDANQLSTRWFTTVRMYRNDNIADGSFITAGPREYASPNSLQTYIDYRLNLVDLDNCIVRPNGETDESPVFAGTSWETVSAGAEIFVNTPAGPLYTISIDDDNRYRINDVSPPLPALATLSLPGETFPTVAAYPISDTEPPENLTPGPAAVVGASSTYSWTAGTDTSSYIEILFSEYDADGITGAPIRCDVLDDGEFELPQDAFDYIVSSENTIRVRYFRVQRRLDYIDGILFLQTGYAVERM